MSGFIFQPSVLVEGTQYKIECIAQWHELIFCGCNDNVLRIFIPHLSGEKIHSYKCIVKDLKLFGKNMSDLQVVEYYDLLIAIIDEQTHFYKITHNYGECMHIQERNLNECKFSKNSQINMDKLTVDAKHLFSIEDSNQKSLFVRCTKAWSKGEQLTLLIGICRRQTKSFASFFDSDCFSMQLFQWMNKGMKASDFDNPQLSDVLKELNVYPLPEKPHCMIFAAKNAIFGFKNEYHLLHLEDASNRTIFGTGNSKRAIGIRTTNQEVILVVDRQGFLIHDDGTTSRRDCFEWSDVPNKLLYAFPYVVAVLPKTIEVHHSETFVHLASYDFKWGNNGSFSCCQGSDNIWRSHVSVSASNDIIALRMGGITEQLRDLVVNKHFSEAAHLCEKLEKEQFEIENLDKESKMRQINESFAYDLFNNCKFKEAVTKFEQSKISPRRIISLFGPLVPAGQCRKAMRHPVDVTPVHETQKMLPEAIAQFLRPYLVMIRKKIEEYVANGGKLDSWHRHEWSKEDIDDNDWPLYELIDTVYMKCLLHTSQEHDLTKFLANQLKGVPNANCYQREVNCFKLTNHCNVEECEKILRQFGKYSDMILLYKSHNQHFKALKFIKSNYKEKSIGSLGKMIEYLQELGQSQPNIYKKLVFYFSEWILKENPDEGIGIFSGKPFGSSVQDGSDVKLPPISTDSVLNHLTGIGCDIDIRIKYLEMLIHEAIEIIVYEFKDDTMTDEYRDVVQKGFQDRLTALQSQLAHQAQTFSHHGHTVVASQSSENGNNYDIMSMTTHAELTSFHHMANNKYNNINELKQQIEESKVNVSLNVISDEDTRDESEDDDHFEYEMKNALVLIICVSKYDGDIFEDLQGAVKDMKWLKKLWNDSFHFQMISNDESKHDDDSDDEIDSSLYYVSENDFISKLTETKLRLLNSSKSGENFDGFIFVFSGHGYKDGIVTSDNKHIKTDYIEKYFSAKEIPLFKDKPKIYIIDACRSIERVLPFTEMGDSRYVKHKEYRAGNVNKSLKQHYKYYHPFGNTLTVYGNTQGYGVTGSEKGGSLITTMSNYLIKCVDKNEKSIKKNRKGILSRRTFHQLLNPIKIELHRKQGGNQTVEINDTLLGFDLYINVNLKK